MTVTAKSPPRGGTAPSYYPVERWDGPSPREAWRALLDANTALRSATPDDYVALEESAQRARQVFADALEQANR